MLFNSLAFAIFLPIVFIIYWAVPARYRYIVLLAANCYFYLGFGLGFFILLVTVTLISYVGAMTIERTEAAAFRKRKVFVYLAVLLYVLGLLMYYKYSGFALEAVGNILSLFTISFTPEVIRLAAPVGISFYTFKIVSYMTEVYKGKQKAEHNFIKYAAYVTFFPQIASGPIERADSFFRTMGENRNFSHNQASYGLKLMAWGFFKKMIIADKLSGYVAKVFGNVEAFSGFSLVVAAFLFSIQIYCDFSGYSDIANGVAKLLGYDGAGNFSSPYFSSTIKEFWSRWHISLSTWFRDYVYIPLGGNRKGKLRYALNIIITFMVSGLWHGAAWNYIIWGGLHGIGQVVETFAHDIWCRIKGLDPKDKRNARKGFSRWLGVLGVFLFATIAWVFFEAATLSDAVYVFAHAADGIRMPVTYIKEGFTSLGINSKMLMHIMIIMVILMIYDFMSLKRDVIELISSLPAVIRWIIYVLFVDLIVIWFLQYGADSSSFVYFNF